MKNKLTFIVLIAILLSGCADSVKRDYPDTSATVCQGLGCNNIPGHPPARAETHKPTKDEKIRARQGSSPDFGRDEIRISFPVTW
ncbi:hypothetical protein ACGVWS_00135 [Enterobacteriaceae bacterium LUAb1]